MEIINKNFHFLLNIKIINKIMDTEERNIDIFKKFLSRIPIINATEI